MAYFSEYCFRGDNFEAFSAIFCSYKYDANASDAARRPQQIKKIITNSSSAAHPQ